MTATVETVPAVILATADGESRPAEMWGRDSWTCAFCQSPTFGPADWEQHERDNAEHYAKRGEEYTWEPYAGLPARVLGEPAVLKPWLCDVDER